MIPLHDDNPTRTIPVVTISLIVLCFLVFLLQLSLGEVVGQQAVFSYGAIPAVLFGHEQLPPSLKKFHPG